MRYDAFISYSHAADGRLAPALQGALQRFAKPWYRRRALRVFRDQTSLAATPELWPSIQAALDGAGHFLLLASPESARSKWVRREVAHWLATKPAGKLLLVLTGGELAWDEAANDFDWGVTDALPPELKVAFASEPLWVDLRWARGEAQLSLKHPRFLEAIGDLAAPLRGQPKEDLLGEDVRQHQRAMRLAGGAIAALLLLLAAASTAAVVAMQQRTRADDRAQAAVAAQGTAEAETARAENEARVALSRQLAAQSQVAPNDLDLGLLLSAEAYRLNPDDPAIRRSLLSSVQAAPELNKILEGSGGSIRALAFSPDGETLASGSADGIVRIWDPDSGRELEDAVNVGDGPVNDLAFSSDGRWFAVAPSDGPVQLWRGAGGSSSRETIASSHGTVTALAYSPDGTKLATAGSDGTIELWHTHDRSPAERPLAGHQGAITSLSWRPDGGALASAGEPAGSVRLWDLEDGQSGGTVLEAGKDGVTQLAYSPDGALLATAGRDGTIRLWDAHSLAPVGDPLAGEPDDVRRILYSPDSTMIFTITKGGWLKSWNLLTRSPDDAIMAGQGELSALALSPDGRLLASGGSSPSVRVWNQQPDPDGIFHDMMGHSDGTSAFTSSFAIAINASGTLIATGGLDGTVILWNTKDGSPFGPHLHGQFQSISALQFSPDGTLLASASMDGTVLVWNLADLTAPPARLRGHDGGVNDVAFSPSGDLIATGARDKTVRLWRPDGTPLGAPLLASQELIDTVTSVSINPKGDLLAASTWSGAIQLWHIDSGTPAPILPAIQSGQERVWSICFVRNGTGLASAGDDGSIRFWSVPNGTSVGRPIEAHDIASELVTDAAGRLLATSGGDGRVRLWNIGSTTPIAEPVGPGPSGSTAIALRPDGRLLAYLTKSATNQVVVNIWDVDGSTIRTFPVAQIVTSRALSDDGSIVAAGGANNRVVVWSAHTGVQIAELDADTDGGVWQVALSADGARVAFADKDGHVRVADIEPAGALPPRLVGKLDTISALAFSDDGALIAAGSEHGTVEVWSAVPGGSRRDRTVLDVVPERGAVQSLAFAPDGGLLAAAGQGSISRWDLARRRPVPGTLGQALGSITSLAFSPDARLLASSGNDGGIRIWDLSAGGAPRETLSSVPNLFTGLAFSHDGSLLAAHTDTDRIDLWETASWSSLGSIGTSGADVAALAFAKDDNLIIAIDSSGVVSWRSVAPEAWLATACTVANRNLTYEEWETYIGPIDDPNRPYHKTCPDLPGPDDAARATPVMSGAGAPTAATPIAGMAA